jgi:2-oxoglutarate dehydrogenase E1 component
METSLGVPTATSVRAVPAKLLIDNRIVLNNHLKRARGGKVSFTHLIGFALVEALREMPEMNWAYVEVDGKPGVQQNASVNLGIAIDMAKPDGTRQLLVPSIKHSQDKSFSEFWAAYEDVVRRARSGSLTVEDFAGTTVSLTNPGTIGTVHSVPRLMQGQGAIIGVGALEYPAEYAGASEDTLARLAISKTITLTSTYDHRIIQGAQSGDFLRTLHHKLLGEDGFYDRVFASLRVPYEPIRWVRDVSVSEDEEINKTARVVELIHAYRVRGHLMADTDPLEYRQRRHPGPGRADARAEPVGPRPRVPHRRVRRRAGHEAARHPRRAAQQLLPHGRHRVHAHPEPRRAALDPGPGRARLPQAEPGRAAAHPRSASTRPRRSRRSCRPSSSVRSGSRSRAPSRPSPSSTRSCPTPPTRAWTRSASAWPTGPPQRARQHRRQDVRPDLRRVRGPAGPQDRQGSGDVKYHLGTEGTFTAPSGTSTKVYLAANPSHLEAVNPVLEGIARAKQDRLDRGGVDFPVLPVLVHGDAAFAGQGVVAETLNLSQLRGYRTGGTVHVIVNNQVGFTTARWRAGPRTTRRTWPG